MPAARRPPAALTAYVLHRHDWSESSLIIDLLTREQGRLVIAAKGARRPYSQQRAVLLPFQRILVTLGRLPTGADGGEVQTLRSAEWGGGAAMLTGSALFSGFYLNELLMKLLARHDPHAALFDCYAATLATLADPDEARGQAALRAFELILLRELGVLPELNLVTSTQQALRADAAYTLAPEAGVVDSRGNAELSGARLTGLQAALQHGSVAALQTACLGALPELKTVLRTLLHYHLGESPLRSRQVMLQLQSLQR